MRFKEWFKDQLLNEDFGSFDSDNDSELFIPTTAGDYAYANNNPGDLWWLQWRWGTAKQQGRKFHNIDQPKFDKVMFTSLASNSMPDTKPGFWKHSSKERPNITVKSGDLAQNGINKTSDKTNVLKSKPMVQWWSPLDQMFGDKPSGKWPEAAKDKPWH